MLIQIAHILSQVSFEKSQITNVDMTSTTFAGGNLSEIVLDGVKLVKTNFQG